MRSSRPEFFRHRSLGAALLCLSTLAHAQPNPDGGAPTDALPARASPDAERVILIVRTPGDDGVMTRLRAELMSSEWRVLEIRLDERQAPLPLATIAEQQRAGAAVRVDVRNGAVELWIARPGGAIQESLGTPNARMHDQVLALRTAEALRARGLLLEPLARPEPEAVEPESREAAPPVERATPPPPVATPAAIEDRGVVPAVPRRPDRSHLWLGLGPGIALSPGGLDPGIVGSPGVRLELGRWSFSAFAVLPITRAEISGSEGRARVATWLFGTATEIEWARSTVFGARSGLGLGASAITMSGEPAAGYRGVDDSVFALAGFLRSSITLALGPSFRVGPLALVGATLPGARVAFGDREAARWGQPFMVLGLVLEAAPLHWN
jgi:hypothetical protein